jgi:acetyl-CoA carboxylase carboxyl transferase subunit alpha
VALAAANVVLMLEHAVYSVISPEGCASILWRNNEQAAEAADALKLTAQDLKRLAVIDDIIAEPMGGAHRGAAEAIENVGTALESALESFAGMERGAIKAKRRQKFLDMGKLGLN